MAIICAYKSCTSNPVFVTPQAMCSLWPITTPGTPAKEPPHTSMGLSGLWGCGVTCG